MGIDPNIPSPPPRGDSGGSNNALYFLVGGLVVLAGVFVFLYTNDYISVRKSDLNMQAPVVQQAPAQPAPAQPAPAAPADQPATGGATTTQ